jgi:type VI secretion system lysozyme-like protein
MRSLSLYNLLVGHFTHETVNPVDVDRSYYERLTEEEKLRKSIIENVTIIFGTRQGSISHLPDFGMPDIMQTYVNAGYTFEPLKKQIRDTILKYEPRIASVRVEDPRFDKNNMHLFLKIVVTVKDFSQTEILLTEFSTTGWTKVTSEKDLR